MEELKMAELVWRIFIEVRKWVAVRGIELKHIQPGNPQQNKYVEHFNRMVRQEYLGMNEFATLADTQSVL